MGAGAGLRSGRTRQGPRRVQPRDTGIGPTFVDATVMAANAERGAPALDGGHGHLQGRDLSLSCGWNGPGRGSRAGRVMPPARSTCPTGRQRMAQAAGGRTAGHRAQQARLCPPGMAERCANATRRWIAGSMHGPPPGSWARIALTRRHGGSLEKQAGVETDSLHREVARNRQPTAQGGRTNTPRRRGWKISTPNYMEGLRWIWNGCARYWCAAGGTLRRRPRGQL